MNKTETQRSKKQYTARKAAPKGKKAPAKAAKKVGKEKKDSLVPLLIILIILLAITSFLAFSERSDILSGLFSREGSGSPTIERPEIIQNVPEKETPQEEDSFSVTNEVEVTVESPEETAPPEETPQKSMKSRLFFVKVSDEGQISLKSIIRQVNYETTPLTETMKSLLSGPDRADLNKGLLNLIPQDTELLNVKISGGIAYLDFSENFRYNSLGFEGYKAQLMQIVYTTTEFETVKAVQILIEGETYDYLGAEGVYIGEPVDREFFNTF